MTLTPAYGRDYKSKKAVLKDWEAGKDFMINDMFESATYINIEDIRKNPQLHELNFRYNNLRSVFVHKLR